jgi:hypothetical protein
MSNTHFFNFIVNICYLRRRFDIISYCNTRDPNEELLTLLIQIEGVLTSRPLTYLYEDNDEPLTPSHLVLGRRVLTLAKSARSDISDEVDTAERATRRERHLKTVLTHFWKRWKQEYLTQLREYHRPREAKGPSVNKGDVVVIAEDNVKRLNWNIGQIEKLLTGRDGNTRAVVVRTIGKDGKATTLIGSAYSKVVSFRT